MALHMTCHDTKSAWLQTIAGVIAEDLDVRLKHVVERIEWGEDGASVHCSSGAAFKCDAVICTVSLGVLKVRVSVSCTSLHAAQVMLMLQQAHTKLVNPQGR